MKSIWQTNENPQYNSLKKDITADVLIIGGGIVGILCAYELEKRKINYVLLEGKRILSGNTGSTTAKITVGHGLVYQKILKRYGKAVAKKYYTANNQALKKYKALSNIIPCDFEIGDLYIYSKTDYKKLHNEYEALRTIGVNAEICEAFELPFETAGAIKHKNQAQFNPVKLLSSLARGLNIYENSFVFNVKGNTAFLKNCKVDFKKVIFACHFPFVDRYGLYFLKMHQHRSYVLALKNASKLGAMYVDENNNGMSFRNYKDYLLLAGGGSKTGKKSGKFNELKHLAKLYYPNAKIEYMFAAQDCITLDEMPYIGKYTSLKDNYFVATGFNTWGMTTAMVASEILCDLVEGKKNDLADVFSPRRSMLHIKLFGNIFSAVINLLTPTVPRCTHLGCALKYNEQEQTYECPCHGSRYSKNGEILDNPTTKDKKIKS